MGAAEKFPQSTCWCTTALGVISRKTRNLHTVLCTPGLPFTRPFVEVADVKGRCAVDLLVP